MTTRRDAQSHSSRETVAPSARGRRSPGRRRWRPGPPVPPARSDAGGARRRRRGAGGRGRSGRRRPGRRLGARRDDEDQAGRRAERPVGWPWPRRNRPRRPANRRAPSGRRAWATGAGTAPARRALRPAPLGTSTRSWPEPRRPRSGGPEGHELGLLGGEILDDLAVDLGQDGLDLPAGQGAVRVGGGTDGSDRMRTPSVRRRRAARRVRRALARSQAIIEVDESSPHQPVASKDAAASAMRAPSLSRRAMTWSRPSPSPGMSSCSIASARSASTLAIVHLFP